MTEKKFDGQVAVVTGAGQGIGFEIARQLAHQGASVILNDIEDELASKAADTIKNEGGKCEAVAGDVSNVAFIQYLVDEAVEKFGKLTIAIANAGITTFGDFLEYQPESLQQLMGLNLYGSFFLTQRAAIQIKKQGSGGRILLMSSVTGHQAHKNLAAYGMTKAGLNMLAKSLVAELSPYNITINTIAPGATLTERTMMDEDYKDIWSRITPIGKPATVQDIANAALFFVSPESGHVTGQSLVVDGGWTSMSPSPY
ncbi:SDR family NAD(P)-dependent oxidoreductase [Mucilaginibacter sp. L3T2-6]|uniref:SDR family NAD(P)-dependent oxidoreductase n=1 Tax=Mucilaginibacter sp. L3T2-6 TaxID=3062491 RepID=UPI002676E55C|nr:SDR family oxidoreductase [Mucilaginibacter sp. L3T2-6]MDO3644033.1 SDR family oxidoreductase [Mucilaginibacter sp. L3T2-6]MDV6216484.1 SDR family oxidoreductase [Mucilaginibacter sp. L3T2-6]